MRSVSSATLAKVPSKQWEMEITEVSKLRRVTRRGDYSTIEECDHKSEKGFDKEDISLKIVDFLKENLASYTVTNNIADYVSIYNVPEKFRKNKEEEYSPRLISIGPIHHGKPHLQGMERHKWRCLARYQQRYEIDLEDIFEIAWEVEERVRDCYQDSFGNLKKEDFIHMICLDSIFLVELFTEGIFVDYNEAPVFRNQLMKIDLLHDLILLENQLPLLAPFSFMHLVKDQIAGYVNEPVFNLHSFFNDALFTYFNNLGNLNYGTRTDFDSYDTFHLIHFLLHCHGPSDSTELRGYRGKVEYTRSASELLEAGVKFQSNKRKSLFEIDFTSGVLTIPPLKVNEWTGTLFRNLIAFEQCERSVQVKSISSYITLMDSLINTAQDVDILVEAHIIENLLGESDEVSDLFNNIHKETEATNHTFYFAKLCHDLNKYSRNPWHRVKATCFRWKRILRRDYFSNIWTTLSVIAAFILLVLTVIQTVCALISV